ncbi:MFS transporter [Paucilactobacillus nenjiangensis]|uniref:MFS transporter n=1 Tax=Paucilactobacillus nenjiangensis TaxID=1296540 RepID=A0A5P1WXW8_9LACO|nr:MFS transporter [Paucilactobacillus nenjiangensis]QER66492.1 MFS transporter [Paucilactobacillus nenjiangensis]
MDTTIVKEHKISPTLTLLALAVSAFAIGSTEFISVGVMPLIIKTFHVSLATAGLTVSVYAASVMIGAPVFTSLTSRIPRKALLLSIMITFIIGNLITAIALIFPILLAGRVVAAFAHGLFMSVATVIAASVVYPMKRVSAIATMFTGLTVATVTGVPLGTFIGQRASWRISFVVIAVIGLIGLISNAILVPKELPMPAKIQRGSLMRMIKAPVVLLSLIVTADGYGASFPVYSYMTTIIADQGWSDSASVIILIAYGLAVAVGNTVGGRVANAKPLKVLMMMFAAMIPMMLLILVGLQAQIFGLILILIMGLLAFMNVPGLQLFTMQAAEKYTPNDVQMASAFNIAAFNLGIMIGSYVGGIVADGAGLYLTPIAGSVMAAIALGLTWLLSRLHTA